MYQYIKNPAQIPRKISPVTVTPGTFWEVYTTIYNIFTWVHRFYPK